MNNLEASSLLILNNWKYPFGRPYLYMYHNPDWSEFREIEIHFHDISEEKIETAEHEVSSLLRTMCMASNKLSEKERLGAS
ncbi:uncharacterized protein LOC120077983 isoform X2 [Benincasa hispida]|uniref:uncharacterized protein LOC120077983 isoform X2 n=1 Tax=Benincasa hispida TaxID=102211 RepID=UPI00190251AA|nr:uncharacterized protein LOC120077983 isoform X2 [Benincasa hispida]